MYPGINVFRKKKILTNRFLKNLSIFKKHVLLKLGSLF